MPGPPDQMMRAHFDPATRARGLRYFNEGRVTRANWQPEYLSADGTCQGSQGQSYAVRVSFCDPDDGYAIFGMSCSCPVGYECKHVVALIHWVYQMLVAEKSDSTLWRRLVDEITSEPAPAPSATAKPIGLLFGQRSTDPRITGRFAHSIIELRPVTLNARGRWVKTKLTWADLLDQRICADYERLQVAAVREVLLALIPGTRYSHPGKTLALSYAGPGVVPALSHAVEAGVILAADDTLGASIVTVADAMSVALAVGRGDDAGLTLTPSVIADGASFPAAQATLFGRGRVVGALVVTDAEICVGEFPSPLTAAEKALFERDRPLAIPTEDIDEFAQALPSLADARVVDVPEGMVTGPAVTGPDAVLRIEAAGAGARAAWQVVYHVDDEPRTYDAHPGGSPARRPRDPDAERQLWQDRRAHLEAVARGCADWLHQARDWYRHPDNVRTAIAAHVWSKIATAPSLDAATQSAPDDALRIPLTFDRAATAVLCNEIVPKLQADDVSVEIIGIDDDFRLPMTPPQITFGADDWVEGDWFNLAITLHVDDHVVPIARVIAELSGGATHMALDDGTYFDLTAPELVKLRVLLDEARAMGELDNGQVPARSYNATLWEELLDLGVVDEQFVGWHDRVRRLASARPPQPTAPSASLHARLRHYQQDGLDWLAFLLANGLGGILADDMGLGKTIQTLALLTRAVDAEPGARFLVVAPTSVIANWAAETARFAPGLGVCTVTATQARAGRSLADQIGDANVVITSYTLLRIDYDAFAAVDFAGAIFDEAQFIKNHNGKTHQCARRLPAEFKLAITGTPMENNLMELWSLLSVAAPGLFSSPTRFRDYFAKPIESGAATDQLATLRRRIRPLMLRRTKAQVAADLPPKQEQVLPLTLGGKHRKIYDTYLARERQKVLGLLDDWDANRFTILRSLTRLRQLSLHPQLVDADYVGVAAAKVEYLTEQIPTLVAEGHSALVFSTFTGFLDIVRTAFDDAGVPYSYLDGTMSTARRKKAIEAFTTGTTQVFLISLKAGGFGLNLTQADYCFVCDPWWNPAAEAQAVDRAHRIGQQRSVTVYRLVSSDTVEEKVVALQERKRELFNAVVDDGDSFAAGITADDVRGLLE